MIVIDRPDLKIHVELRPDPPDPAQYIEIFAEHWAARIRLTATEAIALADALRVAATRGRLVE